MELTLQLSAIGIREGSSDKSVNLGSWKAGFSSNLTLLDPISMSNYTADIVYRVVTVIVRITFYFFNLYPVTLEMLHSGETIFFWQRGSLSARIKE